MTARWATARDWLRWHPLRAVLVALAVITALTGVAEIVAPNALLRLLGADPTPLAAQLFGTVGLFMIVVGALLAQSLLRRVPHRDVVLWSGVQKAGAVVAVSLGVAQQLFGTIALLVAAFDLATAALLFVYWRRLRQAAAQGRHTTEPRPRRVRRTLPTETTAHEAFPGSGRRRHARGLADGCGEGPHRGGTHL
ncbi:hypothetical protein [Cryobacterium sp. CG_9.6]|uniref:hypothetical protein n=1 Tax=Cryobacterium sp. CG_9.6 TaxID=2760710 RepID=UPI002475B2D0|nr:hypothetical protein [Cryobacterium sp. CG_9.6]MDH6236028.1 membrane protein implicated in regulation of membrane protease activity [Cryobacterium sp. CG_9.6]